MKVALLGGTFDPPHLGHLIPVEVVLKEFDLDRVVYVPAFIPPHKQRSDLTSAYHRAAMLALSLQYYPRFHLSTMELDKGRSVYTVETLEEFRKDLSHNDHLFFIVGSDSFLELRTWFRYPYLLQLSELIIINRGSNEEELNLNLRQLEQDLQSKLNHRVHFSRAPFLPVSSTDIRKAVRENRRVSDYLVREVEEYICKHQLYRRR